MTASDRFEDTWRRRRARPGKPERHLREADPRLGRVIDRVVKQFGAQRFAPSSASSHFDAIARSIVYQQLSMKAAATIYGRAVQCLRGSVTPERVLEASESELRTAGLSGSKLKYLRILAAAVAGGRIDLDAVARSSDDEALSALTALDGIGVWTAQMFLMFRLGRLDVLPSGDAGIRKAVQNVYRMQNLPRPQEIVSIGKPWAPYRSIASLYLWALLDTQ
jgi:DNA-3-methyladenine glycosylase II